MAIRSIREEGDEILKKKSRDVEVVDNKIRELLDRMGTISMNEKMFNMAERTLKMMCKIRNFLYGGTKRRSTWINSFMFRLN